MSQGVLGTISPSAQGTTVQQVSVGTRHEDAFNRVFHYAKVTTAIGRGKVGVAAAVITAHNNMSFQTAPAVGDKTVKVTLGATLASADQYKDGWFVVQDGTGEGRAYRIEGNDAAALSSTCTVYLSEEIDTAGALSEANVDLIYNKYDELREVPDTSQAYIPVGVPIGVGGLGASEFGYIQTWGACSVWQDEATATLGEDMTLGAGTGTGQVEGEDAAVEPFIGTSGPAASVATEYQLIYLKLER